MSKKIKILSIDGGGMKGISSGTIIAAIEKKLRARDGNEARISDYFDLIAGTSTGGILACLYLTPNQNGRPKYTAEEAVNIYLERGGNIFDVGIWQRIKSCNAITDEKYNAKELEKTLNDYFGETKLSELLKPCLITSYNTKLRRSTFFNQVDAKIDPICDFLVKDITRATSAAPTYFESPQIESLANEQLPLIDGGIFANNPTLCAYSEARNMDFPNKINKPRAKDMMIVSLGTHDKLEAYEHKDVKDWGKIQWIVPIINILMSSSVETVDYHLKQIFSASDNAENYIRLQPPLGKASSEMDDASPENIKALKDSAEDFVKDNEELIDSIIDKLTSSNLSPVHSS